MFFLVFLQTNKIITNSQCKQRIPSKSQAAMHDREEMQLGRSGTFCRASLVALEAFLMSQQLLKFRMQQLRSQRGSKSAVNLQKKTLQLEVQSLLGWHCGLPPLCIRNPDDINSASFIT